MQIGKYITLARFCKSENADRKGINNVATDPVHIESIKYTILNLFDVICDHFKIIVFLSSGYRSPALNAVTKGASSTSQHSKGQAIDIDQDNQPGPSNLEVFHYIRLNCDFDQLIWEMGDDNAPAWVHVSIKPSGNRKEIRRAMKNPQDERKVIYPLWKAA